MFTSKISKEEQAKEQVLRTQKEQLTEEFTKNTGRMMEGLAENQAAAVQKDPIRQKYLQILSHDYQSSNWMVRKRGKRHSEKHMNHDYNAVFGQRPVYAGQSLKDRQGNIEKYKDLSREASSAVVQFLKKTPEEQEAEGEGQEQDLSLLIGEFQTLDLKEFAYGEGIDAGTYFNLEADRAFVSGFSDKMKKLRRAGELAARLKTEEPVPGLTDEQKMELQQKLEGIAELEQAYEDRIRIISSPYYASLRDTDFTPATIMAMKRANRSSDRPESIKAYAKAMIRWREKGEQLLKDPVKMTRREEPVPRCDQIINRTLDKCGVTLFNNALNSNYASMPDYHIEKKRAGYDAYTRSMRAVRARMDEIFDPSMSDETVYAKLAAMKAHISDKIDNFSTQPVPHTTLAGLQATLRHMEKVEEAYRKGTISKDSLQVFMDRALMHDMGLGQSIYSKLVSQTPPAASPKELKAMDAKYKKKMTKETKAYIENLGTKNYCYFQYWPDCLFHGKGDYAERDALYRKMDAEVEAAVNAYIEEETKRKHQRPTDGDIYWKRTRERNKIVAKNKQYHTVDAKTYRRYLKHHPEEFLHIKGVNASESEVLTRAYLSITPEYKMEGIKVFMDVLTELKIGQDVHFKISTTVQENRVDDITVYFGKNLTVEQVKKCLDLYRQRADGLLVGGNEMSVTATKYADGISLAAEPEICNTMTRAMSDNEEFCRKEGLKRKDDKMDANFSFTGYCVDLMCKSAILVNRRHGKKAGDQLDVSDKDIQAEIKSVFRELCFLNGIDPDTLVEDEVKGILR